MKSFSTKLLRGTLAAAFAACATLATVSATAAPVAGSSSGTRLSSLLNNAPADVQSALAALTSVQLVDAAPDGVPTFLRGDLGRVDLAGADTARADSLIRNKLGSALAAFRLAPADLKLRKMNTGCQRQPSCAL